MCLNSFDCMHGLLDLICHRNPESVNVRDLAIMNDFTFDDFFLILVLNGAYAKEMGIVGYLGLGDLERIVGADLFVLRDRVPLDFGIR